MTVGNSWHKQATFVMKSGPMFVDYLRNSAWQAQMLKVKEVCDRHQDLLICFDGVFSGLRTSWYQLNAFIVEETKLYRDQAMELIRHLGINIGPKLHCVKDHALQQMERLGGIGGHSKE